MLTGDTRDYRESNATSGQVVPRVAWHGHGGGALEVAVRLSRTHLNDHDVRGGQETNLTPGVNGYLDKSLRLSANRMHAVDLSKPGAPLRRQASVGPGRTPAVPVLTRSRAVTG